MTVENTPPGRGGAAPKTVQEYIDETPMWADATAVRYSPMTNIQFHSVFLSSRADTLSAKETYLASENQCYLFDTPCHFLPC